MTVTPAPPPMDPLFVAMLFAGMWILVFLSLLPAIIADSIARRR